MYRGSAYILLGRWIDANDHMYIENLAVDEKQCPPFRQRFGGGGVPPFCHPHLICSGVVRIGFVCASECGACCLSFDLLCVLVFLDAREQKRLCGGYVTYIRVLVATPPSSTREHVNPGHRLKSAPPHHCRTSSLCSSLPYYS